MAQDKKLDLITLPNRNGDKNYLEFIRKGRDCQHLVWYKLNLENKDLGIRTGYYHPPYVNKNCIWIDPSGGPYMQINEFKINDLLLKKIAFTKEGIRLGFVKDK